MYYLQIKFLMAVHKEFFDNELTDLGCVLP